MTADKNAEILLGEIKKEFGIEQNGGLLAVSSVESKKDERRFIDVTHITENNDAQSIYSLISFFYDYAHDADTCDNISNTLKEELLKIFNSFNLSENDSVLVAGLGNPLIVSDSLGEKVCRKIIPTKNRVGNEPGDSVFTRPVCSIAPNVGEVTGVSDGAVIDSVIKSVKPKLIIVVDALRTKDMDKLSRNIQISSSGIITRRSDSCSTLTQENLGIPVIAIGVPLICNIDRNSFADSTADVYISALARIIGNSINMALHPEQSLSDLLVWQDVS